MKLFGKIPVLYYSLAVGLFSLVAYNLPMFNFAWQHASISGVGKLFLIGSLMVILTAVHTMLTYLLVYLTRFVGRILIAITFIINAVAVYFVLTYSVILDETMLGNVFNTRYSEASGFISWSMLLYVLLLGVLPAMFVLFHPIRFAGKKELGIVCGSSLGITILLLLANINQTLWVSRYDTELGGLSMPWSYIVNSLRMASMKNAQSEQEILLADGQITDSAKTAVVLVIGESARKANFQLYGYGRENNPMLMKQEGVTCLEAVSCATYTTAGVRCILEPKEGGPLYEILPNYAQRMGCDVEWRTVNWGEPPVKTVYLDEKALHGMYPQEDQSVDGILFAGLKQRIENSDRDKVLIILHTSTSHGPDYCHRVPEQFYSFTPILDNVEQAQKNPQALINAYDNSILYTDWLVSNLVDSLRSMEGWNTAMMYISDHGESLGENNLFMHGIPMKMAPREQCEIPFFVWTSQGFRTLKPQMAVDQHYVFHSVMNLLSVDCPDYNAELDIFEPAVTE